MSKRSAQAFTIVIVLLVKQNPKNMREGSSTVGSPSIPFHGTQTCPDIPDCLTMEQHSPLFQQQGAARNVGGGLQGQVEMIFIGCIVSAIYGALILSINVIF